MAGLRVEETVYLEGLCQIFVHHPAVDVDQFAVGWEPKDCEPSPVSTGLIGIRFDADPSVMDQLFKLSSRFVSCVLVGSDQLRSIDAQEPDANFWKRNSEAELYNYVHGVAVRNFCDLAEIVVGHCPLLQFIGQPRVQTS